MDESTIESQSDKLVKKLTKLNATIEKQISFLRRFSLGIIQGIGYALGATLFAGVLVAFVLNFLRTTNLDQIPIIQELLKNSTNPTTSGLDCKIILKENLKSHVSYNVPIYSPAKDNTFFCEGENQDYTFVLESDHSPKNILDFYKKNLTLGGWEANVDYVNNSIKATEGMKVLEIFVTQNPEGSGIVVSEITKTIPNYLPINQKEEKN